MFEGNAVTVGVDGSALTEGCGDLEDLGNGTTELTELDVEDVEDALEWEGT